MRDATCLNQIVSYGGEGGKPEPAKPKPVEKPADKPQDPPKPAK
jgi:hypothetical protein